MNRNKLNMKIDTVKEIKIDEQGRLCLYPATKSFAMIYREAAEVHWDASGKFLYSPKPREWSYADWYKHIITVVGGLRLTPATIWTNVPLEVKKNILAANE